MSASNIPNESKALFLTADVDLEDDTIRAALFNDEVSYTFDPDAHEFVSDVLDGTVAEEFGESGGSGYSRQTLANAAVSANDSDDVGEGQADDLSWTSLDGETIQGVIFYKQVGGDDSTEGDDPVLWVIDDSDTSDFPLPTNGSQIDLNWAADGFFRAVGVEP